MLGSLWFTRNALVHHSAKLDLEILLASIRFRYDEILLADVLVYENPQLLIALNLILTRLLCIIRWFLLLSAEIRGVRLSKSMQAAGRALIRF